MSHPWEDIDLDTYEAHMSSTDVFQIQTLNKITEHQLSDYNPSSVAILGIAGGNGLDKINDDITKKVYCIDVNKKYLDVCKSRYTHLLGILEFVCCDLSRINTVLPFSDIHICNLIIEYLGEKKFAKLILNSRDNVNIVSCVIQKNNEISFVSSTNQSSEFQPIMSIHNDIDGKKLTKVLCDIDFYCIKNEFYKLPNGKEFLRIDFQKRFKDAPSVGHSELGDIT